MHGVAAAGDVFGHFLCCFTPSHGQLLQLTSTCLIGRENKGVRGSTGELLQFVIIIRNAEFTCKSQLTYINYINVYEQTASYSLPVHIHFFSNWCDPYALIFLFTWGNTYDV